MTTKLVRAAAAACALYAARRYYRNWGTTKEECRIELHGDELIMQPATRTTEGITIDAPAEAVWPMLMQIGHAECQTLKPGDVIQLAPRGWHGMCRGAALTVEHVIENSELVLRGMRPDFPWLTVISIHVLPRLDDRCRVLVRTRTAFRRPIEVLLAELAGPAMTMLTRRMLIGIKRRAENQSAQTTVNSRSGSEPNMNRLPETLSGRIRT